MDVSENEVVNVNQETEFADAFALLQTFVDLRKADELLPLGPAAVYTTSVVLWLLIYQRLNKNASLEMAVKQLLGVAPNLCPDNKRIREKTLSAGTGSYSDARKRVTREVVEWLAHETSNSMIATFPPTWGQRRAFVIDGTTIALAPEKELRKAFPPASNQHGPGIWPIALLLVTHELESGCALLPEVGPMYGPNAISEAELARRCFSRLPQNSIVLGDVNFGIFSVVWAAVQHGQSFLCRLSRSRFNTLCRQGTLECRGNGWKTWIVHWKSSRYDRKTNPYLPANAALSVLVHEVVVHPELTLWLVTNLSETAPAAAFLYGKRGNVETDISNIKVVLDTENIRAKSEAMFHKELLTSLVAYNLVVQFRQQAAKRAKLPIKRLSFTKVWTTFRHFLLHHTYADPARWYEQYELALRYAMKDKLPNRPGRNFERAAYKKRAKTSIIRKRPPPTNENTEEKPK
jgi:hypothetical protein